MRLRAAVSAALASAGILLAGWQSGTYVEDTGGAAASTSAGTAGTAAEPTTGAAAKAGGTYAGSVVQTRFGAVQVQITVKSGSITDVEALQLTDDDRKSIQISNRAAPLLRAEVLAAQSADVQTIGGATVTSDAYLSSLQAAIDAANL
ncbi:FMN-binding protein [Arthrobacter sp. NPDC093128]|uniref:FMN-binding protein n=1 Tax=Arthrobacter sp. NPDC093128 TaxID=3154979 RepID=UPI003428C684